MQEIIPKSIFFKSSRDAHKLVEEFMLLANRRVAEFIGKQKPKKPFVYRVHDSPDEDKAGLILKAIASTTWGTNSIWKPNKVNERPQQFA